MQKIWIFECTGDVQYPKKRKLGHIIFKPNQVIAGKKIISNHPGEPCHLFNECPF
jgi:hypothetical protein